MRGNKGFSLIEIMVSSAISASVMLGAGAVLTNTVVLQKRSSEISDKESLRDLLNLAIVEANALDCSNRLKIPDSFNADKAQSDEGQKLIVDIAGSSVLPPNTQAGTKTSYGTVDDILFANAVVVASDAKSTTYQGVLYVNTKMSSHAQVSRHPAGVISLEVYNGTNKLKGCAQNVDPLQAQCEILGDNLAYNASTGTCTPIMVARAEPPCIDGERAYTDNQGLLRCLPLTKGNACSNDPVTGEPRFPVESYLGNLNCGKMVSSGDLCAASQENMLNLLRCLNDPETKDDWDFCQAKWNWQGVHYACAKPILEDYEPPTAPPPPKSADFPKSNECRCANNLLSNGESCRTCYAGNTWNWDYNGVYLVSGFIRKKFTCTDGELISTENKDATVPGWPNYNGKLSQVPCSEDER